MQYGIKSRPYLVFLHTRYWKLSSYWETLLFVTFRNAVMRFKSRKFALMWSNLKQFVAPYVPRWPGDAHLSPCKCMASIKTHSLTFVTGFLPLLTLVIAAGCYCKCCCAKHCIVLYCILTFLCRLYISTALMRVWTHLFSVHICIHVLSCHGWHWR